MERIDARQDPVFFGGNAMNPLVRARARHRSGLHRVSMVTRSAPIRAGVGDEYRTCTKDPDVRILISRTRRTSTVVLVQQLVGRTVLIVHGDRDQLLPQRSSPAYAERAGTRSHDHSLRRRAVGTHHAPPSGRVDQARARVRGRVRAVEEPCVIRERIAVIGAGLSGLTSFGAGCAETLRQWHGSFHDRWDGLAEMGFSERFRRMWEFYLAYSEDGFRSGYLDVWQFGFRKPAQD